MIAFHVSCLLSLSSRNGTVITIKKCAFKSSCSFASFLLAFKYQFVPFHQPHQPLTPMATSKSAHEFHAGTRRICSTYLSEKVQSHVSNIDWRGDMNTLTKVGHLVLTTPDPDTKALITRTAFRLWKEGKLEHIGNTLPPEAPARPDKPLILESALVKQGPGTSAVEFFLHSVAHVELNAIDLSWDIISRFGPRMNMPRQFYHDFFSVADDESKHFSWLQHRLRELGSEYGVLTAHNLIWDCAEKTKDCLAERLALGQLVQEARGIDAGPKLAQRVLGSGDIKSSKIIQDIADEEITHVAAGVRWFLYCCEKDKIEDPIKFFQEAAIRHSNYGAFKPPFNESGRRQAGMEPEWYLPVSEVLQKKITELLKNKKVKKVV